ncbi:MAG: tetratricopeptide repeat protein [Pirellula sp.]
MKKAKTTGSFSKIHFNWKLMLATLLLVAVVAAVGYVVHNMQTRSISTAYLRLAKQAKDDGDIKKSRNFLEKYTRLNPDDADSYADLALLVNENAKTQDEIKRSITILAAAIGRCESRDELKEKALLLRRKQAARLYDAGRYDEALEQIASCSESEWDPEQARLLALTRNRLVESNVTDRWSARAESIAPKWLRDLAQRHVVVAIDEALRSNPGDIELTRALAKIFVSEPQRLKGSPFESASPEELGARSRSLADSMVASHDDSPEAWLAQYAILNSLSPVEAYEKLARARQKFPEDRVVAATLGQHLFQSLPLLPPDEASDAYMEQLDKAEEALRASVANATIIPPVVAGPLGAILMRKGRFDDAMEAWTSGMKGPPPTANLHFQVVASWISKREWEKAETALKAMDKSIDAESPALSRSVAQAISFQAKQRWAEYYFERKDYEAVVRMLEPLAASSSQLDSKVRAKSIGLLAQAFMATSQWDRAGNAFEAAASLDPTDNSYKRGAANALVQAARPEEALRELQGIEPKEAEDWLLLAQTTYAIQAGPEPIPDLWKQFDEALREARSRMDEIPTYLLAPGRIKSLELLAKVARATSEDRAATVDAAASELIQRCQDSPQDIELWRRSMTILDSWKQRERLIELQKQFIAQHPNCREAVLARATELLKANQADAARQLVLDAMTNQPEQGLAAIDLIRFCSTSQEMEAQTAKLLELAGNSLTKSRELADLLLASSGIWFASPTTVSDASTQAATNREAAAPAQTANATPATGTADAATAPPNQDKEKTVLAAIDSWNRSLESIENNIRKIEGEAGTEWKALRARRFLELEAKNSNQSQLTAVAEIARTLEAQRPLWPISHIVSGNLAERRGDLASAVKHYRRAISLGGGSLDVFERLISILFRQGAFAEAQQLLKQLGDNAGRSNKLEEFAIRMPGTRSKDSLSLAKSGIESRPLDPMAWVVYGIVLEATSRNVAKADRDKQLAAAYDAFDKASQLDGARSPKVLNAEYGFFSQLGDRQQLEKLYQRVQKSSRVDEASRLELQGRIEMSLGKFDEAETSFKNAMAAGGSRVNLGNQLGKLYLTMGKTEQAVEAFEQLYRDFPKDPEVRKSLATVLFSKGTPSDWERLQAILLEPRNANETSDRRYLAVLRYRRGNPSDLEKAKNLLEDIVVDSTARTNEDSFMLATIATKQNKQRQGKYASERERLKNEQLADRQFGLATSVESPEPIHLASYIDFLIDASRIDDASNKLQLLSTLQPEALGTAMLEARIKKKRQRMADATAVLEQWKSRRISMLGENMSDEDKSTIDAELAVAFIDLEDFASADKQLDALAESSSQKALEATTAACSSQNLASRSYALGRLTELLKTRSSAENGIQLMRLLTSREYESEPLRKADALLLQLQAQYESNKAFLMSIGDMWLERKAIDRAIDAYRKVLVVDPSNLIAMNNIACLVAEETGRTEESLEIIDKALEIGGRNPFLLDSKGHILAIAGRHADSIPLFEEAATKGTDPRAWLHLYTALKKSGRNEDAIKIRSKIDVEAMSRLHLSAEEQREIDSLGTGRDSL